jgi:hypothetical protein
MQEQLEGGNVKGGVLKAHLDWFRLHHAALGVKALGGHVSADTRAVLSATVLPSQWYPFRALIEADRAIAAVHGGDEKATVMDLGRHSARQNLSTSYRAFASLQLQEFYKISAKLHRQYEDFGHAAYETLEPTAGRLSVLESRCFAKTYCWSGLGYLEQAAALQGVLAPQVVESECRCEGGQACRFEIRWKEGAPTA